MSQSMPTVKATKVEEKKRLWDNYKVIGEIQKSDSIKFVVGAGIRDGVRYINIREFYHRKRDGVWKPGRDGITVPVVVPIKAGTELIKPYEGLIELLAETVKELDTMPLSDINNAVYVEKKVKKEKEND